VHHASNPRYLDKNLGMFLILWDKLFGTFEPEDSRYTPIRYGLTKDLEDPGPVNIIFHEWKSISGDLQRKDLTWKERIYYLFGSPGWSHDGSRQTSKEMRREEEAAFRS